MGGRCNFESLRQPSKVMTVPLPPQWLWSVGWDGSDNMLGWPPGERDGFRDLLSHPRVVAIGAVMRS